MPHTKSAAKRLRQTEKRRKRNKTWVKGVKKQRKEFAEALAGGDAAKTADAVKATQKKLDQAAAAGVIHKNKAARLKSRMVKKLRAAQEKPAAAKS